jgi:hypothetical protein
MEANDKLELSWLSANGKPELARASEGKAGFASLTVRPNGDAKNVRMSSEEIFTASIEAAS